MTSVGPRRLSARSHLEAYDLWAKHFADPALMANRDAHTTLRKLTRVAERLPIGHDSVILDVGPGDGTLFRIVAGRVAHCYGVDPSAMAVEKLTKLHADLANVEFAVGSANGVPFCDAMFDVVVVNSVLQMLPSHDDLRRAVRELVRVCKPGGLIFVGELPFRSELGRGIVPHVVRKLRESGVWNFARLIWNVYIRPVLRGEPILTYPATNLFVPVDEFIAFCEGLGLAVDAARHQEMRGQSKTRYDYVLRLKALAAR